MRKALLVCLLAASPGAAFANDWSLGSSMSSGRYGGAQATRVSSSSIGFRGAVGGWSLGATVPYLQVRNGDRLVVAGGMVAPGSGGKRSSGYGDVQLRIERSVAAERLPFNARVSAHLKAPTGNREFSTGKADGGVSVELSRAFGAVTPHVSAGYRIHGDMPGLRLKNGWSTAAGATVALGSLTLMASYERSHALTAGPAPRELFGLASYPVTPAWNWSVYGSKGLTAGSADLMIGTALTRRIF